MTEDDKRILRMYFAFSIIKMYNIPCIFLLGKEEKDHLYVLTISNGSVDV